MRNNSNFLTLFAFALLLFTFTSCNKDCHECGPDEHWDSYYKRCVLNEVVPPVDPPCTNCGNELQWTVQITDDQAVGAFQFVYDANGNLLYDNNGLPQHVKGTSGQDITAPNLYAILVKFGENDYDYALVDNSSTTGLGWYNKVCNYFHSIPYLNNPISLTATVSGKESGYAYGETKFGDYVYYKIVNITF